MSTRNLEYLMNPSSIAVIGAGESRFTVGEALMRNILGAGFGGEVFPVNPKYSSVAGLKCYRDVRRLPASPDLAVIAAPSASIPEIMQRLTSMGTKAVVMVTVKERETGEKEGSHSSSKTPGTTPTGQPRIVGPNCFGIAVPGVGLNASLMQVSRIPPGPVAFVAQSGAVEASVLDCALSRGIGFSHLVSLGDMTDVDFGDVLDYLDADATVRAILLYMETVAHTRKFMSAVRSAAKTRPVIVLKAGRSPEGARAAMRHTGAVAGDDEVYDAAFARAGTLRVHELEELLNAAVTLTMAPRPVTGDRLAILTNGGGIGVIATDSLIHAGGRLAELSPRTIARLDEVLPSIWSRENPVDIQIDAPGSRYAESLAAILDDPGVDAVLVLYCPTGITSGMDTAARIVKTYQRRSNLSRSPTLLTSWMGDREAVDARLLFTENRIPTYRTPEDAVKAFMHLTHYQRSRAILMETPPGIPEAPLSSNARKVLGIRRSRAAGENDWLTEAESKLILAMYDIPVLSSFPDEFPDNSRRIESNPGEAPVLPARADSGFESAYSGSAVRELMIQVSNDVQFGPVIALGRWGETAEKVRDRAVGLPPLNMTLAHELISRTRISRLLEGSKHLPKADPSVLATTLVRVSELVCDLPEIAELVISPLQVSGSRVMALNARMRISGPGFAASQRLAIRPYPKELEEFISLPDGRVFLLRPIKPEDEPEYVRMVESLTSEQRLMRFLHHVRRISHDHAARMTQIDYDREMTLVLTGKPSVVGRRELYGTVSINAAADNERAEYAVLVRADVAGKGLGRILMERIIGYAGSRGIKEIFGHVRRENGPMLKICDALGFSARRNPDDHDIVIVSLKL